MSVNFEFTYRDGKPLAGYLTLPGRDGRSSARTESGGPGLVVDFDEADQPVGIEIIEPTRVTPEQINDLLAKLGLPSIEPDELAPLPVS